MSEPDDAHVEDLTFRLADPDGAYERVRLVTDFAPALDLAFAAAEWTLHIAAPRLRRIEYRFEVTAGGVSTTGLDPANPLVAPNTYGDRSVLELPGYAAPDWLAGEPVAARRTAFVVAESPVGRIEGEMWLPAALRDEEPAPLLVVHDGSEYDEQAALTSLVGVRVAAGDVPPVRVLLLNSPDRMVEYAVRDAYADALVGSVLPRVRERWATSGMVALGASMGALAALHAHWSHPGVFVGLLLQSGSYFRPGDYESEVFEGFDRITAFTETVLGEEGSAEPVPTVITCGALEENVANNRLVAQALARRGYPTTYVEWPDLHTYISWRDALEPHLSALIRTAAGAGAP